MNTATIKIIDNRSSEKDQSIVSAGQYNGKLVHFGLKREEGENEELYEILFIKYGERKDFELCSVYVKDDFNTHVYISATVTGKYGDIQLETSMWLKVLLKLGSVEKIKYWQERLQITKAA